MIETSQQQTTALEKTGGGTPPMITQASEYLDALARWNRAGFHVLTPFTNLSGLADRHALIASMVTINTDPDAGEVYDGLPFLKAGEVAIAKLGLRKIAECGAISTTTLRTDPLTIAGYWEFKAQARYRSIDGSTVTREATAEWDLRDGSARLKGWKPNQIEEGRKNGARGCETRAINAAIREFGIKQKYTRLELRKPFVVLRVAYQPDMSDPLTRQIVTEAAIAGTGALYGDGMRAPRPVKRLGAAEPTATAAGRDTTSESFDPEEPPGPDEPPTDDAVRIVDVTAKRGETNGRKWSRFSITDSHGEIHSTFSATLAEAATQFKAAATWVEIITETDGQYQNLVEIAPAGQSPELPGLSEL